LFFSTSEPHTPGDLTAISQLIEITKHHHTLLSNYFAEGLFFVVGYERKEEAKPNAFLVRSDFAAQLQPFARRQFDFHTDDLANINPSESVNETSAQT
jgi:hypothetical protein